MKYIVLIIGLLVVGCGKAESELTAEEKVIGTYERKTKEGDTYKKVFLDNGVLEGYTNGDKLIDYKWSIVDGEIHTTNDSGISVHRINPDGSITWIAIIQRDGGGDVKRGDFRKEGLDQFTLKKISGIGGAIRNWVEVTNISNGMRYFLAIVIVSLMIWYFKRRN